VCCCCSNSRRFRVLHLPVVAAKEGEGDVELLHHGDEEDRVADGEGVAGDAQDADGQAFLGGGWRLGLWGLGLMF